MNYYIYKDQKQMSRCKIIYNNNPSASFFLEDKQKC